MVARVRKFCGAKTHAGTFCKHPAGFRTDHPGYGRCYWHGGANPNGKRFAAKQMAAEVVQEVDARRAVERATPLVTPFYGPLVTAHPREALLEELARSKQIVEHLQKMLGGVVGGIDPEAGSANLTSQQHELLKALREERIHLVRIGDVVSRLGLDRPDVEAAEIIGDLITRGILNFIRELGHSVDDPGVRAAARNFLDFMIAEREADLAGGEERRGA